MTDLTMVEIRSPEHVSAARRLVQAHAVAIGLSTLDVTKFVTAASELARNVLVHGGGGTMTLRDRKSTRLNSSHLRLSRMPSSA